MPGRSLSKEVIAFLVDEKYSWPAEQREDYRLIKGKNLPPDQFQQLRQEVQRNEAKLAEFKGELSRYVRGTFTDAASIRHLVSDALGPVRTGLRPASPIVDPDTYLRALEDQNRTIRVTGFTIKRAEPYVFGIDEIYM